MAAKDAEHRGEAEAATGELGGEERVEDAGLGHGLEAAAGVTDREAHVATGAQVLAEIGAREQGAVGHEHRGLHGDEPGLLAERVAGVGDQVHHHLTDLRRVALDVRQVGREVGLQPGLLRDHRAQQL